MTSKIHYELMRYISPCTEKRMSLALSKGERKGAYKCIFCKKHLKNSVLLSLHLRAYFTKYFCICGFKTATFRLAVNHLSISEHAAAIYEVDILSFPEWTKKMKMNKFLQYGRLKGSERAIAKLLGPLKSSKSFCWNVTSFYCTYK